MERVVQALENLYRCEKGGVQAERVLLRTMGKI